MAVDTPAIEAEKAVAPEVPPTLYSIAILPFTGEDEALAADMKDASAYLYAYLSASPIFMLTEGNDVEHALGGVVRGPHGSISMADAVKVGYLTGSQILLLGHAVRVELPHLSEEDEEEESKTLPPKAVLSITAQAVGTETGQVTRDSVQFPPDTPLADATRELARRLVARITQHGPELVAGLSTQEELIARFIGNPARPQRLPSLSVEIDESGMGLSTEMNPVAATELTYILQRAGFEVIDPIDREKRPDIRITGRVFGEFGTRKDGLVSSKSRMEITVTETRTNRVLRQDRLVSAVVNIASDDARKEAILKSATRIAERLLDLFSRPLPSGR